MPRSQVRSGADTGLNSIQAVFATTQLSERRVPFLPAENTRGFEERAYLEKNRAEYQATLAHLDEVLLENAQRWFKETGKDPSKWNAAVESARGNGGKSGQSKRRNHTDIFGAARNALSRQAHVRDFHVTLLRLLGLDDNKLTYHHAGRFKQLSQFGGKVIQGLIG